MSLGADTFLAALRKTFLFWQKHAKSDSLVSYTKATRVEPICIIDSRALHLSYTHDILQSMNSLFAGFYLQAAALSVNIGKINVGGLLGHLNPDQQSHNAALEHLLATPVGPQEDYRYGLPRATLRPGLEAVPPHFKSALDTGRQVTDDAIDKIGAHHGPEVADAIKDSAHKAFDVAEKGLNAADKVGVFDKPQAADDASHGFSDNLGKGLAEAGNLSVGRTYSVDITDGDHKASIPVQIRLLTTECASDLLVHILSDQAKVKTSTAKERSFGWKLGELKFWKDIVFATDLVDEHKKALMSDKTGVYKQILDRRAAGQAHDIKAFFSEGHLSVGTASNLVVMTRQTVRELEAQLGGKWSNFEVRQKVFDRSYLMVVAVVDPDYDHITFYYRGIELATELTVKDLKKAGKDSGSDILELLKTFQSGNAPRF
jgi:hypothetical protein